jgi:hypothetical protein
VTSLIVVAAVSVVSAAALVFVLFVARVIVTGAEFRRLESAHVAELARLLAIRNTELAKAESERDGWRNMAITEITASRQLRDTNRKLAETVSDIVPKSESD